MPLDESARKAELRFHGELAGLVARRSADGVVRYPALRRASIKDVAESLGVPHTEIYLIECGGVEQDFGLQLGPGMEIDFHPAHTCGAVPVDPTRATLLRPEPLRRLAFLVDENVAGLALLLRALGFDAAYDRLWDDHVIAEMARKQGRFVLSRDRGLLKRSSVCWGKLVRSQVVDEQLAEVAALLGMRRAPAPFSRCLRCNKLLEVRRKQDVFHLLKPKTKKYFNEFSQCPKCGRIYWRGSHTGLLQHRLEDIGIRF